MSGVAPAGPAAPRAAARTPLMEQYLRIKQEQPDAFLFYRLGDFYEMFFEDATVAARLLGLTLTSRNKQDPSPIPMCGIPWHQRDAYVARLLRLGHKVAICDQLEEPSGKGLVQRGVTEILTPGSVTSDQFLDPGANNFLGGLWPETDRLGVCFADASTGEVRLAEPAWEEAPGLMARARVAEWVTPLAGDLDPALAERLEAALRGLSGARSPLPLARFTSGEIALARWGARGEAVRGLAAALRASAAALDYLDRMQGGAALQLTRVEPWGEDEALRYDAATARHLELFQPQPGGEVAHTLWHHLDLAVTPLGARRLRGWIERPLATIEPLRARQDAVEAWTREAEQRAAFREALRGLPDLERLAARLACGRGTPRDLGALRDALARIPELGRLAASLGSGSGPELAPALAGIPALQDQLARALVDDPPPLARDGGLFRAGWDAHRDSLDALSHSGKRWVAELEATERARTAIPSLKVGYNRVFGYYLEVTRAHLGKVPADYERRQTLTTAERFVTPALKARESEILSAEAKLEARELELFAELRERAAAHVEGIQRAAEALGRLDAEAALGEAAVRYGWVRPVIEDSDRLILEGARHPVVERLLPRGEFVPNHVRLEGASRQILLLTGPNMGGKSTYLRSIALAVLLAQCGSWVPASAARMGVVDRLFTRVGAADRLGAGQSTFMVEMSETADILRSATSRSLVLLDEVGRGTSTYDGLALAWAVTEHLHGGAGARPRTIFATHYHELTQLSERLARLANVHVTVKEWGDRVVFLHRIAEGAADRSYGIHVAQLAGLPESVITRAKEVLAELESERTPERLERAGRDSSRPADGAQLPLFGAVEHPLAGELRKLDPDGLTPIEALRMIAEGKERWGSVS